MILEHDTDPRILVVAQWLSDVGLEVRPGTLFSHSFNEGIWIENGAIVFDPTVAHPGDMLHEAGHLAVLPSVIRRQASGDFDDVFKGPCQKYLDEHPNAFAYPEDQIARAIMQASDYEAIAWAYAAALAAGVDPWLTCMKGFPDEELGESTFSGLKTKVYPGIDGLVAGGMLERRRDFPRLRRWLQP